MEGRGTRGIELTVLVVRAVELDYRIYDLLMQLMVWWDAVAKYIPTLGYINVAAVHGAAGTQGMSVAKISSNISSATLLSPSSY